MNHFKWVNFIIYEIDLKIAVKKEKEEEGGEYTLFIFNTQFP